jgi:nicotinamide mononucleotide transporter
VSPVLVESISLVATVIAVAGVVLNNHRVRWCFALWLCSNAMSAAVHLDAHLWGMLARDSIFLLLAVHGWWAWGRIRPSR